MSKYQPYIRKVILSRARWMGAFFGVLAFDVVAIVYIIITNK